MEDIVHVNVYIAQISDTLIIASEFSKRFSDILPTVTLLEIPHLPRDDCTVMIQVQAIVQQQQHSLQERNIKPKQHSYDRYIGAAYNRTISNLSDSSQREAFSLQRSVAYIHKLSHSVYIHHHPTPSILQLAIHIHTHTRTDNATRNV